MLLSKNKPEVWIGSSNFILDNGKGALRSHCGYALSLFVPFRRAEEHCRSYFSPAQNGTPSSARRSSYHFFIRFGLVGVFFKAVIKRV